MSKLAVAMGLVALGVGADSAHGFCGFYVSGSGQPLINDATQVVLMRSGTRTVLAMQNDYRGPIADFAMVVPVPVVLHEGDVKTLDKDVFEHVEALGAPRLVEYWEQDPCEGQSQRGLALAALHDSSGGRYDVIGAESVKVEAKFDVAEYQIVILSATEATGLETWLTANHYAIPNGAAPLLRPYVEAGSKFFVAKVDPTKLVVHDGHAALSPLRFDYDSEDFTLPIRLGTANAGAAQDLIVNIFSPDRRYQVANYPNALIPTNLDVTPAVRERFGEFYAALFDATLAAQPRAVVTEYAWTATPSYHCDPCAPLDVSAADLVELGSEVVGGNIAAGTFVMTRLHARYSAAQMIDDLRFEAAPAIVGGREETGDLDAGPRASDQNYFQARYAIRHPWDGPIACTRPQRGRWGEAPYGEAGETIAASQIAFAPRGKLALSAMIARDQWPIRVGQTHEPLRSGCGCGAGGGGTTSVLLIAGTALVVRRRTSRTAIRRR